MDVRQVEVGLKNVEISGQSFYSTGITDPRFTATKYHIYTPDAAISDSGPMGNSSSGK